MWNGDSIRNIHILIKRDLYQAAEEISEEFGTEVKKEIASTREFGGNELRNDTEVRHINFNSTFYTSISMKGEVANILEHGAKPHEIKAKEGEVLSFELNGEQVFTKSVDHPGVERTEFFSKACEKHAEKIDDKLRQKMIEISTKH